MVVYHGFVVWLLMVLYHEGIISKNDDLLLCNVSISMVIRILGCL